MGNISRFFPSSNEASIFQEVSTHLPTKTGPGEKKSGGKGRKGRRGKRIEEDGRTSSSLHRNAFVAKCNHRYSKIDHWLIQR